MMMSQAKNVGVLTSQQEGIMVGFLGLLNEHALPVFSVCVCVFPQISATVKNMYDQIHYSLLTNHSVNVNVNGCVCLQFNAPT